PSMSFFFQAEAGIRDFHVTGGQTCALPIFSPLLADAVEAASRAENIPTTRGGTYLVMEGPQFSTKAESELYRSWGCSVIGMTNKIGRASCRERASTPGLRGRPRNKATELPE